MLVLSRTIGETVMIGDVEVTVVSVARGKVKLGITAPLQVKIMRKELDEREQSAQKPLTVGEE